MNRQDEESSEDQDEINEEDLIRQAAEAEDQDEHYIEDQTTQNSHYSRQRRDQRQESDQEESEHEDIQEQIQTATINQEEGLLGEDEIEEIDTQFEMMNQ